MGLSLLRSLPFVSRMTRGRCVFAGVSVGHNGTWRQVHRPPTVRLFQRTDDVGDGMKVERVTIELDGKDHPIDADGGESVYVHRSRFYGTCLLANVDGEHVIALGHDALTADRAELLNEARKVAPPALA